jgi:competence protein ComEA
MHAWCTRLIVIALALALPSAAMAAEKAASAADKPAGKPTHATTVSATVGDAKVNINTANAKQLATLEGIGAKVAERIVAYREAHGPFKKPEDLRKVEGIGKGLWERNRDRVVVK